MAPGEAPTITAAGVGLDNARDIAGHAAQCLVAAGRPGGLSVTAPVQPSQRADALPPRGSGGTRHRRFGAAASERCLQRIRERRERQRKPGDAVLGQEARFVAGRLGGEHGVMGAR